MNFLNSIYLKSPIWIQQLFCVAHGINEKRRRYALHFKHYLNWLDESQWWSLDKLIDYQNIKLREMLKIAYEQIPFYRERFRNIGAEPEDIQTVEALATLPTLTKNEVIQAGKFIHNSKIPRYKLVSGRTSGTTGTTLKMFYTKECYQFLWAVWWRHRGRFGINPKHRHANFGSRIIVPFEQVKPPFWRENPFLRQTFFSQYHMRPDLMKYYIERLNQTPYDYYAGFPSAIYLLASYIDEKGISLKYRPKVVFPGAESLLDYQKDMIQRHIAKPTDEYGAAEAAGNASKCEYDYYHIDMELGVMEIIPLEGVQQKKDQIVGRVVVTGLINKAMPLIRYELDDIATFLPNFKCPCGRVTPVLKSIDGRIDSYIVTKDGRRIGRLSSIFFGLEWVKEAQIIQESKEELRIRIVPRYQYNQKDLDLLLRSCRVRLGKEIGIRLDFIKEIPRSKSGKYRFVVSNIKP